MTSSPLIQLQQVSFAYSENQDPLLDTIEVSFADNQRVGLIGPNGSGKTSLLHLIMGLQRPTEGKIFFNGNELQTKQDFQKLRKSIGLVFQDADDQLFSPTVIEDVAFGPLNLGKTAEEAAEVSHAVLAELGLSALADRVTHHLSGGEKKLVSLATILSMRPRFMLLDEPTNNLDPKTRTRLIEILNRLDIGYMIVSHDWDFLAETCQDLYALDHGKAVRSTTARLHVHRHAHLFGNQPHEHDHVHENDET
jgi:cobalt/nickel transport system ATP-binding protein